MACLALGAKSRLEQATSHHPERACKPSEVAMIYDMLTAQMIDELTAKRYPRMQRCIALPLPSRQTQPRGRRNLVTTSVALVFYRGGSALSSTERMR